MFHLKFKRSTGEDVWQETNISCTAYSVSRNEAGVTHVTSYADSTDTAGVLRYVTNDPSKYPEDVCVEGVEGTEATCVEVFDVCYVRGPSGNIINAIL